MGVFSGSGPAGEMAYIGKEPCKPEYEKMIANVHNQMRASKNLYDALLHYIDVNGGGHDASSQGLLGALIVEIREQEKTVGRLVAQQEAEAEKK